MSETIIIAILASTAASLVSALLTGIVTVARIKVYMEWFKQEIRRVDQAVMAAHARIDGCHDVTRRLHDR